MLSADAVGAGGGPSNGTIAMEAGGFGGGAELLALPTFGTGTLTGCGFGGSALAALAFGFAATTGTAPAFPAPLTAGAGGGGVGRVLAFATFGIGASGFGFTALFPMLGHKHWKSVTRQEAEFEDQG